MPLLLPRGGEEKIVWKVVPIDCGWVKIPRVRVVDRRKAVGQGAAGASGQGGAAAGAQATSESGDIVKVVDVRYDVRREADGGAFVDGNPGVGTVLVLP